MPKNYSYLPYKETGSFSRLALDHVNNDAAIASFGAYAATKKGMMQAIADRAKYPVDRATLVATLNRQYGLLKKQPKVEYNITLLLAENTYTVCTAHQPNLLTGYLYFVYKILHAIKLAEELGNIHPDKHFVPVYYMGSEDNDIAELGVFRFRGEKFVWDGDGQQGAVGRMRTEGLKPMLKELFKLLGPPGENCDALSDLIRDAYLKHDTVAAATQYLVNELFGRYGLVILDPDDAALKALFVPVMEDELLHQYALPIVEETIARLEVNYKSQAYPRAINLFYLVDGLRERIEKTGDEWTVINTTIKWNKDELVRELHAHPERFSPNVVLRPLFQETILPDVAFIGGGAEVAYWLQLKGLFEHYNIFLPSIHLRQSVMVVDDVSAKLREQLGLNMRDVFKPEEELVKQYITEHSADDWQTSNEAEALEQLFAQVSQKVTTLDSTLEKAAAAALTKMKRQLEVLEKKMLRAEKRKLETEVARISKLKRKLFPGHGLQERVDNFMEYYLEYGPAFFDMVKEGTDVFDPQFLVIE
jgi:bacillithiol biosynthesis cysteine-adding enzyme BshC